jgi:hypothetical protein
MKLGALLMLAGLAAAGSVPAQTPDGGPPADRQAARAAVMKSCDADIKSLCADKQGREMMACLRENTSKVSTGCSEALAKMPARGGGAAAPAP